MPLQWETEITLLSNHYTHLRCKIFDISNHEILASSLINNNCPTSLTIEKKPDDFVISLINNEGDVVEEFFFGQKNMIMTNNFNNLQSYNCSPDLSQNTQKSNISSFKKQSEEELCVSLPKQTLIMKKQGDSCSITLKVKHIQSKICSLEFIYQELEEVQKMRVLASIAYKKIEERALKQIKRNKQKQKKLSLEFQVNNQIFRQASMNSTMKCQMGKVRQMQKKNKSWLKGIRCPRKRSEKMETFSLWKKQSSGFYKSKSSFRKDKVKSSSKPFKIQLLSTTRTPPLKTIPFLTNSNIISNQPIISSSRVKEIIESQETKSKTGCHNFTKIGYCKMKKTNKKWNHHRYLSEMLQISKLQYKENTKSTEESSQDQFWAMRTVL